MILYLIGQWTFVDGSAEDKPFYLGYTRDPQIAHAYYNRLVEKEEHLPPSKTVTDMYFIQEISKKKMETMDELRYVEEIDDYGDGVYMTATDFEYYADIVSGCYDDIRHAMEDGDLKLFVKKLKQYAKISKKKKLKVATDKFIDATNDLYKFFQTLEDACEDIDWAKAQRKF